LKINSRSVTHPQIAPGQARLTSKFFADRLPEKKLQLVGMSILLILLSPGSGCHNIYDPKSSHYKDLKLPNARNTRGHTNKLMDKLS